jgi:hypothetical protein
MSLSVPPLDRKEKSMNPTNAIGAAYQSREQRGDQRR